MPLTRDGIGGPEPVPDWIGPRPETPDAAFCPEHAGEYVPPVPPTRAAVHAMLIEQGAPPDIADSISRDFPEE